MSSLVSELRRRNVLRVAATYALVAWIIIEAGSVLLPTFGAPEWAFQVYVIAVFAGFIVSVILAWVFELTPEGLVRDSEAVAVQPRSADSKQRANIAIIALLIVALTVSITLNVTGLRDSETPVDAAPESPTVAVLPFASLSSNPENTLFADGVHDDVLTKLANVGSLKVISRTSVMEYRDTEKPIGTIARELGVNTVLSGTVQRVGDSVRINMQLIDVASNDHLWADSFDRQLTAQNIFDIQSEISRSVSLALRSALTSEESGRLAAVPTADLRAYSLYTAGKNNLYQRRRETLLEARGQFEQAIELDPDYADAYVGFAQAIALLMINHQEISRREVNELGFAALERALELDPEHADAHATVGLIKMDNWSQTRTGPEAFEAEQAFERALDLNPNHASAYMWFASLRDTQQRPDDAIALYEKSQDLDPLGRIPWSNLPALYAQRGRNQQATDAWLKAIEVHPEWPTPYGYLAVHLAGLGRLDEALAWQLKALSLSTDPMIGNNIESGVWYEFGELERAKEHIFTAPPGHPFAPLGDAFRTLIDGNMQEGMDLLDQVIASGIEVPEYVYPVAADVALMLDEYEKSRRYVLLDEPILNSDAPLTVDRFTVDNIVMLAYIDNQLGDTENARLLAEKSLPVIQEMPRLGIAGHGILDVEAYLVLGRVDDALSALEQAVNDGMRTTFMRNTWPIYMNPMLRSIHADPRFELLLDKLQTDLEIMHRRVLEAEANGSVDQLRQRTIAASSSGI